jgi:hypothetical protein
VPTSTKTARSAAGLSIYSYNGEKVAGRRLIEQLEGYAYAAVDLYKRAGDPLGQQRLPS